MWGYWKSKPTQQNKTHFSNNIVEAFEYQGIYNGYMNIVTECKKNMNDVLNISGRNYNMQRAYETFLAWILNNDVQFY